MIIGLIDITKFLVIEETTHAPTKSQVRHQTTRNKTHRKTRGGNK